MSEDNRTMTKSRTERLLAPKLGADGMMTITEAAKAMRAKPSKLFAFLEYQGLIVKDQHGRDDWLTTAKGRGSGVVTDREWRSRSGERSRSYAVVTPSGLNALWKYKQQNRNTQAGSEGATAEGVKA